VSDVIEANVGWNANCIGNAWAGGVRRGRGLFEAVDGFQTFSRPSQKEGVMRARTLIGHLFLVAIVVVLFVVTASRGSGVGHSASIPAAWAPLEPRIEKREVDIDVLSSRGYDNLALSILVILAGAIASGLQLRNRDSARIISGICGVVAGAVTAINSTVFPIGWKEIEDRTSRATAFIDQAMDYIATHPTLPDDERARSVHTDKVMAYLRRADFVIAAGKDDAPLSIEAQASPPSPLAILTPSTAFAGVPPASTSSGPSWVSSPPRGNDSLYFVGEGRSDSLANARDDSLRLVKEEVERTMLDRIATSTRSGAALAQAEALARLLSNSGAVVDTWYRQDLKNSRTLFVYYTLFRVKKQDAEDAIASYGVGAGSTVPPRVEEALLSPPTSTQPYYERRWRAYASALDMAREELAPDDYQALLVAREARKEGRYQDACDNLQPRVHTSPGWYLGWYNLALAYSDMAKVQDARTAYEQAASLEPTLHDRDASIYNSFGAFLLSQQDYSGSMQQLKKALRVEPELTGARYALARAERAIRAESGAPAH
jgi:tetratricopeptide (TPR) repeat protein